MTEAPTLIYSWSMKAHYPKTNAVSVRASHHTNAWRKWPAMCGADCFSEPKHDKPALEDIPLCRLCERAAAKGK